MRKFTAILTALILFATSSLMAQYTISGTVTDEDGEALIGATVRIQDTEKGVITDIMGKYLLNVSSGTYTVQVDFLGSEPLLKTVTVANKNVVLDFSLREDAELLGEVVVVGYGTQRKRELIGTVAQIDSEELLDVVGGSFENVLQGKASGVQITQSSGIAGAGSVVRIRGVKSISSGGEPLFVVDGIPITQDNFLLGSENAQNNNPLSSINPNDIQSIEILKDAAAASIYGSRGANGVVLITTKRGGTSKPVFEYTTRIGTSNPTKILGLMNAEEWLQVRQEAWNNDGNTGRAPLPGVLTENGFGYDEIEGIDTDWLGEVIQTGIKHEHNLSMKQGNEKLSSYVGLSYSDAGSYVVDNRFRRASARANLDYNLTDWASVSLSTSLSQGINNRVRQAWAGGFGLAQSSALPIYPIYDNEGNYFNIYGNPIAERELTDLMTRELRSINSLGLRLNPVKRLSLNFTGNYDYMNLGDYLFEDAIWTDKFNIADEDLKKINNWSLYNTATYDVKLPNKKHQLKLLAGQEYQDSETNRTYIKMEDVSDHLFRNITMGENADTLNNDFSQDNKEKFFSLFTRVNYSFSNKYLFQLVYRSDWSSKFGPKRRRGDFPSVGVGYILTEEPFLKEHPVINFLKIKAGWGLTGNADIAWNEQFAQRLTPEQLNVNDYYNGEEIRFVTKLENPFLKWEKTSSFDVGAEIGLWDDRVTASLTYYHARTADAIIRNSLQASFGIDNLEFWENAAEIVNKGVELELTTRNLTGKLQWTTDLNIAQNDNKVIDVASAAPDALDGGFGDTRVIAGYPVGSNFIVPFSHIDPASGRPVYLLPDGTETFTYDVATNRQVVGDIIPDVLGGITNTFKYKDFDFSFLWTFSLGSNIYDDAAKRQLGVVTDWNMRTEVFDRWRQPGDTDVTFPQLTMTMLNWGGNDNFWQNNSSLWLYDGSYARLKNLTLGYNYDVANAKSPFDNIRVYFNATNVLTFTKYPGWDPEVSRDRNRPQERNAGGTGVSYLTPPQERTLNVGVNVRFR